MAAVVAMAADAGGGGGAKAAMLGKCCGGMRARGGRGRGGRGGSRRRQVEAMKAGEAAAILLLLLDFAHSAARPSKPLGRSARRGAVGERLRLTAAARESLRRAAGRGDGGVGPRSLHATRATTARAIGRDSRSQAKQQRPQPRHGPSLLTFVRASPSRRRWRWQRTSASSVRAASPSIERSAHSRTSDAHRLRVPRRRTNRTALWRPSTGRRSAG